jgi:hypothetical protein
MKKHDEDDAQSRALDDMIDVVEGNRGGAPSTTAHLLMGLDAILSCVERMEDVLRRAPQDVVTGEDRKALRKAFLRMKREAHTLVHWLRYTRLEEPRN